MTERTEDYPSKITVYVVVCWILAAFGGLMFGYDIGISGFHISFYLSNLQFDDQLVNFLSTFYIKIAKIL